MVTIDPNYQHPRPDYRTEIEGVTYGRTFVREAEPGDVTPWGETVQEVRVRKYGTTVVFDSHVVHYGDPHSTILLREDSHV